MSSHFAGETYTNSSFSMSIEIEQILAAAPATTRGQPTQLSVDAKGERLAYAVRLCLPLPSPLLDRVNAVETLLLAHSTVLERHPS